MNTEIWLSMKHLDIAPRQDPTIEALLKDWLEHEEEFGTEEQRIKEEIEE